MTIKDVELQTGLARANIRYYEDQGFFTAARGENGYRDYSSQDVEILLKVKLLRQLGFSLEDIRAVQRGERALSLALAERESGLEGERQTLDQALDLCRAMRQDGADFYTLDARRYLDRLARKEAVLEEDKDPARSFPWRRYFARTLDMQLCVTLLVLVLQFTVRLNILRASSILLGLGGLLLAAVGETVMLHLWGTTPGKALLGLKLLRGDGSRLSLGEAAQRTAGAAAFYGVTVLLVSLNLLTGLAGLAMLIWACWRASGGELLPWENGGQLYLDGSTRERSFWENRKNLFRVVGYLAVWAACIGLMVGGSFLASMPPHRGPEITVEQFVDNYNRFMEFADGKDSLRYLLTEEGVFEEIPREGVVIDLLGYCPVPQAEFRFTEENGLLTRVSLVRSYNSAAPIAENQAYSVDIPYGEAAAAARSFLWRPLGLRGTAELYQQLVERDGSLSWEREGFRIDSEMSFSGYSRFGSGFLFAQEGQNQSYFVEFTIELTK